MLSVSAPIWLAGLAVIPLIWWLHRLGDPDAAAPVSAAFLFHTQADEAKTSHALPRANPLWILRATLFSLLVLALARLHWSQDPERRVRHGLASRDRVMSLFSIERMVSRYEALYKNALETQTT